MTPLERATTAVMNAMGDGPGSRDRLRAQAIARAVITAIREPSDEMKRVGTAVTRGAGDEKYWADGVGAYEAMIDALLEGAPD